ncbi:hypothetical protein ACG7TL_008924 [Trametes sanguinea]
MCGLVASGLLILVHLVFRKLALHPAKGRSFGGPQHIHASRVQDQMSASCPLRLPIDAEAAEDIMAAQEVR